MSENPHDPAGQHESKEGRWDGPIAKAQTQTGKQSMPTVAKRIPDPDELPKFSQRLSAGTD